MLKVAIVGNIASGKSAVEKIISEHGYLVYDSDKIAHEVLDKSSAVSQLFSDEDIFTDDKIDRKKLGAIVFNDKEKLKLLELIIHPQVVTELLKIFQGKDDIVFVSVPQLFEAGFEVLFDKKIFISSDREIRIQRLMKRNGLTREDAVKRIEAQLPEEKKIPLCDYVVNNNSTLEELGIQIQSILSEICS